MALNVNELQGKELADDYIRKSVPKGRWADTWDVFKSSFSKIVLINILVLVTFIPGIAVVLIRSAYISGLGGVYPFNSSIVYPFYPDITGLNESVVLSTDVMFYALMIVAGFVASLGISGGIYSMRKLLNTHGEFTFKGFMHGIRKCYFSTLVPVTLFLLFFYGTVLIGDWRALFIAQGGSKGGATTAYVISIIATVLVGIYCAWMLAVGATFKLKPWQLLKNSLVLMIGTPIQTIFMAGFALIPVWIMFFGGFFRTIAYIFFIFLGFSFILISWTSYTQWVFDMFIKPNLAAAAEQAKAKKSPKELEQEKVEEERRLAMELLAAGRSELIANPLMPIAETAAVTPFGNIYSRSDVTRAGVERAKLRADIAAYIEEHKNDPVYAEYNKLFEDREKALKTDGGKKGKKNNKKISSDNLLR